MDTRKLDPLNQLGRLVSKLSNGWDAMELDRPGISKLRRAVGWSCLPVFVAFTTWMLGSLFGVWPSEYSAYSQFWAMAWFIGALSCFGLVWGLRD